MQRRKDNKGRVLKDGEVYRKSDGLYMYRWTAKNGKRHTIYDATLEGLRKKSDVSFATFKKRAKETSPSYDKESKTLTAQEFELSYAACKDVTQFL